MNGVISDEVGRDLVFVKTTYSKRHYRKLDLCE